MSNYKMCWIHRGWDKFDGLKHAVNYDSIDEIISTMSRHIYNGEWIEDMKGDRLDIDLKQHCLK